MRAVLMVVLLLPLVAGCATAQSSEEQFRVAWHGDGYAVTFSSQAPLADPRVRWTGAGKSGEIGAKLEAGAIDPMFTYSAKLPPEAERYTVGTRSFDLKTPPAANGTTRVVFLADMGIAPEAAKIAEVVRNLDPDLVLHGGDLSYAEGNVQEWNAWFRLIEPVASRAAWMPALGNHELVCFSFGVGPSPRECANEPRFVWQRFTLPNEPAFYYAFDWGPMRIVSIDTEAYHDKAHPDAKTDAAAQKRFLVDALADRPDSWNVVFFHRPVYSSSDAHGSDLVARADLEPVLDQGADLVLQGHDHMYERTWPLKGGAPSVGAATALKGTGAVYVVSGGAGRSLYEKFVEPAPAWSAFRKAAYHVTVLDVSPDRIDVRAVGTDGAVFDAYRLARDAGAAEADDGRALPGNATPDAGLLAVAVAGLAALAFARRRHPM
ncbi:MAG TPA: purple acid phosphatase [Candidatus Thermoplasmatota archaeon]|nr:purple acid phosphatase [Candidatus Thermoplasmatota archaeon]